MGTINDDPILRNAEAAEYLGVSPGWLNASRMTGNGPDFIRVTAQKLGYRKSALDAFIEERTNAPYLPERQKRRRLA